MEALNLDLVLETQELHPLNSEALELYPLVLEVLELDPLVL